ncbi:MAG: DUF3592 domain-containing protein [Planctomycetes bacterium]|nr:DUF3592 domain-containing protein [Planctomycetota bacterium]
MGLRPKSVAAAVGLATLGASAAEADARYEQALQRAPLLAQGNVPRRVSLVGHLAACGGHFIGWFGAGWLSFSAMMSVPALAFTDSLGILPVLFVGLFVSIGLLLVYFAIKRGLAAVRIVKNGALTWAVITNTERKVSTSRDSDGNTTTSVSYDVSFMYRTPDGVMRFGEWNLQRPDAIVDEPCELLLYDPEDPTIVEFADLLPGGLRIDSQGNATESVRHNMIGLIPFGILLIGPIFGALMLLGFLTG